MALAHFILGVAIERTKLEARRKAAQLRDGIEEAIENLPDEAETAPCTGDLLCQRQKVRHRAGCIGKDAPFADYVRGLK